MSRQPNPPSLNQVLGRRRKPPLRKVDLSQLEWFGKKVREHYRKFLPDQLRGLQEEGEDPAFIGTQEREKQLRFDMKDRLPPGGYEELIQERFFPRSPKDPAYRG